MTADLSGDNTYKKTSNITNDGVIRGIVRNEHVRVHTHIHADVCSGKPKMFDVIMETIDLDLPAFMGTLFSYAANPGLIIPAVLLMV